MALPLTPLAYWKASKELPIEARTCTVGLRLQLVPAGQGSGVLGRARRPEGLVDRLNYAARGRRAAAPAARRPDLSDYSDTDSDGEGWHPDPAPHYAALAQADDWHEPAPGARGWGGPPPPPQRFPPSTGYAPVQQPPPHGSRPFNVVPPPPPGSSFDARGPGAPAPGPAGPHPPDVRGGAGAAPLAVPPGAARPAAFPGATGYAPPPPAGHWMPAPHHEGPASISFEAPAAPQTYMPPPALQMQGFALQPQPVALGQAQAPVYTVQPPQGSHALPSVMVPQCAAAPFGVPVYQ